jgi:Zn-finger in ubiquitin-hydrolases and other protein
MMRRHGASAVCAHPDHVLVTQLPDPVAGCEDCLASGGKWLHLPICLECGRLGCCDDSPARHASAHAYATDHPLIRSLEPHEEWCWCFVDMVAIVVPAVRGRTRIPPSPLMW